MQLGRKKSEILAEKWNFFIRFFYEKTLVAWDNDWVMNHGSSFHLNWLLNIFVRPLNYITQLEGWLIQNGIILRIFANHCESWESYEQNFFFIHWKSFGITCESLRIISYFGNLREICLYELPLDST